MVREVERDRNAPRRGRPPKYPWEEWFDGRALVLERGEDYQAESPKSFRSTVYSAARRMGVKVETWIDNGELHIQAILDEDGDEEGEPEQTDASSNGKVVRRRRRENARG